MKAICSTGWSRYMRRLYPHDQPAALSEAATT
jgi:hypothetical protein